MNHLDLNCKDVSEAVSAINKHRLANKNKWYLFGGFVNDKPVQGKAYGTWIQILRINSVDNSGCMDISVATFKAHLTQSFN
jgi:hypothetical protein